MTQVSSNTLAYDQIYLKIKDFYTKDALNKFASNQDKLEAYKQLLSDIYEGIGAPITKFEPFVKGEPPLSNKFNSYAKSVGNDLALISKQTDYINARILNIFNLFNQEIESEKKYIERIASKAMILQMYSQSPANDIDYLGDSFDNQDQIDVEKIAIGLNPNIENGAFTLPIDRSRPWIPKSLKIDTVSSNGFLGNDHQVIKKTNVDQSEVYEFIYKKSQTISSLTSISDSNPATFFEFGALNVDKDSAGLSDADKNLRSENEFCYIANRRVSQNKTEGELVNWSNFNVDDPLTLTITFESSSSSLANSVTITPYFASANIIKVKSITATLLNGDKKEILVDPIFIGSSFVPLNPTISKNYFYNKATIKFSEIKVSKFDVTFEQEEYQNIEIYHSYWKPNYSSQNGNQNPFYGLSRFNPDALSREIYETIDYDQYSLLPTTSLPNQIKDLELASRDIDVRLKKKPTVYNTYLITMNIRQEGTQSSIKAYFYNWNTKTTAVDGDSSDEAFIKNNDIIIVDEIKDMFNPPAALIEYGSAVYSSTEEEISETFNSLISFFEDERVNYKISFNDSSGNLVANYICSDVKIEQLTYTNNPQMEIYSVPIILQYEKYNAKRKAIGIRDISFDYEIYSDKAQIVSTPYLYKKSNPVEVLMLSVDSDIDNDFSNYLEILYYVSINGSSWINISPIQLSANGIPEVLVFNKNIPSNYQLPGVSYINYPQIANEVTSIVVKIDISKSRNYNITPSIFSYRLITRVKN